MRSTPRLICVNKPEILDWEKQLRNSYAIENIVFKIEKETETENI